MTATTEVYRLRGHVPHYRVTFADGRYAHIRYSAENWHAELWSAGRERMGEVGGFASLQGAIAAVEPNPQPVQDILRGYSVAAAREEAERMTRRAEDLTRHLARYHYGEGNMVGRNVRAERDACEMEAFDLLARVAEVEAMQHARGAA